MSTDEEQEKGFRVVDRRGSSETRSEEPEARSGEATAASGLLGSQAAAGSPGLPEMDFATFILSLSTSAFYHLGLVPDPETGAPAPPNLELARQTIDILEMLQQKTRGNLEVDEANLIESLLYDLHMRFVEARKP